MQRRIGYIACVVGLGLISAAPANADPVSVIGGTPVIQADGLVIATYLGDSSSLFNNQFFLDSPGSLITPVFQTLSSTVDTVSALGPFVAATPLLLRDQAVLASNPTLYNVSFFTGTGANNPDGIPHAVFTFDAGNASLPVTVGFEDLLNGGDRDYNDLQVKLSNVAIELVPFKLAGLTNSYGSTLDNSQNSSLGGIFDTYENEGTFNNSGGLHLYGSLNNAGTFSNVDTMFTDLTSKLDNQFGALLANESTGTLSVFGLATNLGEVKNAGSLLNAGSMVNAGIGLMRNLLSGTLNNSGTVANSGTMINDTDGTIVNGILAVIRNIGDTGKTDNLGTFLNQGEVDNQGGTISNFGSFFNLGGGLIGNNLGGQLANSGILDNFGSMVNAGIGLMRNLLSGTLNNSGAVTNDGTVWNSGTMINDPDGTIVNGILANIRNDGRFQIDAGGSVSGEGKYVQDMGTTIVNGELGGSGIDILGGSLGGAGTITGPTFINTGVEVNPGNSPGTLHFLDSFTLTGGVINLELLGPTEFDFLDILDLASFSGGTVNYFFSYVPQVGDTLKWLNAAGGLRGVDTLGFNYFGAPGFSFETRQIDNSLVLRVLAAPASVPEPTTGWLLLASLFGLFAVQRGRRCRLSLSSSRLA